MAQGPHSYILLMGWSEGFFESEILDKREFFGSMKDARIFWGCKKHRDFLGIAFFISSNQQ